MTTRLVDSPACMVVEEGDISGHLARMLKQAGQTAPGVAADAGDEPRARAGEEAGRDRGRRRPLPAIWREVLFDQALLAEGGVLEDPAAYVRRVNALLLGLAAAAA